jgi:hypothetical protein
VKGDAVIDGELVALDKAGISHFQLLQNALRHQARLLYCAFDLMFLDGEDLRSLPLLERKERLKDTVETDGRLPTGQDLKDAIAAVDTASDDAPAYYMVNCAHPTHFEAVLAAREPWIMRMRGLRANASRRSHAELDEAPDLDDGDPVELGAQYAQLLRQHPQINVLGGCCGTDHRHIEQIAGACKSVS